MIAIRLELRLLQSDHVNCSITAEDADTLESSVSVHAGQISGQHACCFGRIAARRLHGAALMFCDVDTSTGDKSIQVVVEGSALCNAMGGLAFRLGSTVALKGCCGRTRRGAFSLFVTNVRLISLPPEPAAASRLAQV